VTVDSAVFAVVLGAVGFVVPALADEEPKRGGTLNYMIPADAPPSFDAHREGTFATVYSGAPFYSVLIRVDPNNPSSTTDFVCDWVTCHAWSVWQTGAEPEPVHWFDWKDYFQLSITKSA